MDPGRRGRMMLVCVRIVGPQGDRTRKHPNASEFDESAAGRDSEAVIWVGFVRSAGEFVVGGVHR